MLLQGREDCRRKAQAADETVLGEADERMAVGVARTPMVAYRLENPGWIFLHRRYARGGLAVGGFTPGAARLLLQASAAPG